MNVVKQFTSDFVTKFVCDLQSFNKDVFPDRSVARMLRVLPELILVLRPYLCWRKLLTALLSFYNNVG